MLLVTSTSPRTRQGSFFDWWLFFRTWAHTPQAFLETWRQAGHIFAREKDTHSTGNFTLTSHVEILNMEGIVRRGLRIIVLIREELKV